MLPIGDDIKTNEYARKSETITDLLMQKCPEDLSCVLRNIQHSPRIPGNIAVVVQLLHNISMVPMEAVSKAKMQVSGLEHLGEHFLCLFVCLLGKGCRLIGVFCELFGV